MDDVNLAVVRVETTGSVLEAQYLTEPHAFTRAEVDRRVVTGRARRRAERPRRPSSVPTLHGLSGITLSTTAAFMMAHSLCLVRTRRRSDCVR